MDNNELLEATDSKIEDAVQYIEPIVLRGLLYQLTGDETIAAIPHETVTAGFRGENQAIIDPENIAFLRAKASEFLKSIRDAGGDCPVGSASRLHRSLELAGGASIPVAELEMWIEQTAIDPMVRGLDWPQPPAQAKRDGFLVAVVGAGMGGLNAAVHLQHAGIPFVVIEKNAEVGGTWHENRYPGARVDSFSRSYFHAFGADFESPGPFCRQAHNEKYFNWVADQFSLRSSIVFNTEVQSMDWNDDDELWEIRAKGPDGTKIWHVNAVISGVGLFNRAYVPNFPGSDNFTGQIVHTSRWPANLACEGKRIAVIGSGATSYQMFPELAKVAAQATLFQRTPSWCLEVPGYLATYPPQVNWLDRNFPYLVNFLRFRASWLARPDSFKLMVNCDPNFSDPHTVSADNKRMRDGCLAFLERKFAERPDLLKAMLPSIPPMTSRPVLVDSENNIYDALLRDNVSLATDPIERITPDGIQTANGREYPLDIIIYATGFKANDFLYPMEVRGRGGRRLAALWEKDGARAYLGTMLPGFPNLFMLYGPNMNNFGSGLGIADLEEMVTRFALKCMAALILKDHHAVDVSEEAYHRYNAELDRLEATKVYSDSRITNYYRNEYGRSAVNCPFDIRLMWNWLREPDGGERAFGQNNPLIRPYLGADLLVTKGIKIRETTGSRRETLE